MTNQPLELTHDQQALLLRGLRFVRSSVALTPHDFSDEVDADRRERYARIGELESMLNGTRVKEPTTV